MKKTQETRRWPAGTCCGRLKKIPINWKSTNQHSNKPVFKCHPGPLSHKPGYLDRWREFVWGRREETKSFAGISGLCLGHSFSSGRMSNGSKDFCDSRRSWFVCASSFAVQFIIFGIHSSVGIFFIAFEREFHRSESATGT